MQGIDYASVWRRCRFAEDVLQLEAWNLTDRGRKAARKRRIGKKQRPCARLWCDDDCDGSLCFGGKKEKEIGGASKKWKSDLLERKDEEWKLEVFMYKEMFD